MGTKNLGTVPYGVIRANDRYSPTHALWGRKEKVESACLARSTYRLSCDASHRGLGIKTNLKSELFRPSSSNARGGIHFSNGASPWTGAT